MISELSKVPLGWEKAKFGDIAQNITDRIDNPKESGLEDYIGLEHLDTDEIRIKRYGSPDEVEATKFLCKKGDIVFGKRRAYLRKLAVTSRDAVVSAHSMVLRPKEGKVISDFLPWFMQSSQFWKVAFAISEGSLSPTIKWKTLSAQEFWLPSRNEQKKIAGILWGIESNAVRVERLIQVTEKLKKGLLEELLTRGIGHKKFKKTELGEIPEHWEMLRLSECVEILPGYPFESTYFNEKNEGVPVIRIRDLLKSTISTFYSGEYENKYLVRKGDILIGMDGEFETIKWSNSDALLNQRICKIESSSEYLENDFLFYYLAPVIKLIETNTMGTTVKHLSINDIKKVMIPIPPLSEQNQIVKILSNTDDQLMELHNYLSNVSNLKKKLTNSFLSGELPVLKGDGI